MSVKSYKCPNCGAGLAFKPDLQKFRCDYCLSEFTEAKIQELNKDIKTSQAETEATVTPVSDPDNGIEKSHLASYECNSCGAHVVTDETTTATFCYYCHNPVILSDRLSGSFEPNKMIPFTIDKEKAQAIFLSWATKNRYVPRSFYSSSQLEKITGIYLPYWWADCEVGIDYKGEGRAVKVWEADDLEYTETKKYQILRTGNIQINNVEELAFTKIDHDLLNGIAPYVETEAVPFSMPYLSGFFAEQFDISKEIITPKIEQQVQRSAKLLLDNTLPEYNAIEEKSRLVDIRSKKFNYTLLPAWILTYQYGGKTYVFAVNGQTGKSFGELPIDSRKVFGVATGIFAVASTALFLGGMLLW